MTTTTINEGEKSDIDLVLNVAKHLGVDFSVTEEKAEPAAKTKKLSYAERQKRLYEHHNLPMPK